MRRLESGKTEPNSIQLIKNDIERNEQTLWHFHKFVSI